MKSGAPDRVEIAVRLATRPPGIDLATATGTLELADDEVFFSQALNSLSFMTIPGDDDALLMRVTAGGLDLGGVDRVDHTVTVNLTIGTYRASHARRWQFADRQLSPVQD